jgi:hypothetical protein
VDPVDRLRGDGLAGVDVALILSIARFAIDRGKGVAIDGLGDIGVSTEDLFGVSGESRSFCLLGSLSSATSVVKSGLSDGVRVLLNIRLGDMPGPRYLILRLAGDSTPLALPLSPGLPTENRGPGLSRIELTRRFGVDGPAGVGA